MLKRRPELDRLLFEDIYRSRFGEEAGSHEDVYPLPIFGVRDGKFTSHYSLTYIEAAQMVASVPKLTAAQREAIDLLMRHAAGQQPRDLPRPHRFRGRRQGGKGPAPLPDLAVDAEQPPIAGGPRGAVALDRGWCAARRHWAAG
jgi:hypothetical protein